MNLRKDTLGQRSERCEEARHNYIRKKASQAREGAGQKVPGGTKVTGTYLECL